MPDANRESIEHFVRVTLGCRCPDEVFASVGIRREPGDTAAMPLTRLVVGNRLLIYIAHADGARARPEDFEILIRRGQEDRDDHGLNRFRLVVAADHGAPAGEAARLGFERVAAGSDRMQLHVLSPDALPKALRGR